jgi:hypothetical protein
MTRHLIVMLAAATAASAQVRPVRDTSGAFVPSDRLVIDSISPNPFSPARGEVAGIALTAPSDSRVTVTVLDMDGRVVRELLRESTGQKSGPLFWDGTDDLTRPQPAGIYLLNVRAVRSKAGPKPRLSR